MDEKHQFFSDTVEWQGGRGHFWRCSAGKDRVGSGTALLLLAFTGLTGDRLRRLRNDIWNLNRIGLNRIKRK